MSKFDIVDRAFINLKQFVVEKVSNNLNSILSKDMKLNSQQLETINSLIKSSIEEAFLNSSSVISKEIIGSLEKEILKELAVEQVTSKSKKK